MTGSLDEPAQLYSNISDNRKGFNNPNNLPPILTSIDHIGNVHTNILVVFYTLFPNWHVIGNKEEGIRDIGELKRALTEHNFYKFYLESVNQCLKYEFDNIETMLNIHIVWVISMQ